MSRPSERPHRARFGRAPAAVDARRVRRAGHAWPAPDVVAALAETFKVLGDPTRLRLACELADGERCVSDLAGRLGVSASAVSHSLRALRQLRLVTHRKAGKAAYYRLGDAHVAALLADGLRHASTPPPAPHDRTPREAV